MHTHPHTHHTPTHTHTHTLHTDQSVQVYPTYGNILGGDVITIQGCLNGEVICEFDGVRRSATSISNIEALCVVPPLTRVGMVTLRVLVDEQELGTTTFTSGNILCSVSKGHCLLMNNDCYRNGKV